MSNLVYNGNFSFPDVSTNTTTSITSLTAQQRQQLFWYVETGYSPCYLIDGSGGGFPLPSLVSATQFIAGVSTTGNLSQDITVFKTGTYNLSFNYSTRGDASFGNIGVYFKNSLFDTVTTAPPANSWATYSNTYNCTQAGTITLRLQMVSGDGFAGITNVSLTPLSLNADLSYNNLKNTNVFGSLNVDDSVINGATISGSIQTPKLLVNGENLSTQLSTNVINYNYSTLPSYVNTNLGYKYYSELPSDVSILDSGNYTEITRLSNLPVGVYYVSYSASYMLNSGFVTTAVTLNLSDWQGVWGLFRSQSSGTGQYVYANSSFTYKMTSASTLYLIAWNANATALKGYTFLEATRIA